MNLFNKLQGEYDQLWKYIIRPTRTTYPESALGPETFYLESIKVKRNSFQLINDRGLVFYGSHYVPLDATNYPCVIYLHGNSSNQTEGVQYLSELIKNNISLCTFDFSGCGNAEGEYITLGYNEWKDVEEVHAYLRAKQKVTKIGVWGRSMGAVTALRFITRNEDITVGVFDSPFKSLKHLISDLSKRNSKIPGFILTGALKIISKTIKEKANFDIYDLDPLSDDAPKINIPGFFIVGKQDELTPPFHTKQLYDAYHCKRKQIRAVEGEHNSPRPESCINDVIAFLKKQFARAIKKENRLEKSEKSESEKNRRGEKEFDFFDEFEDEGKKQEENWGKQKQIDFFKDQTFNDFSLSDFPENAADQSQSQSQSQSQQASKSMFSLNEIFSGVFTNKTKQATPIPIHDDYNEIRSRIQSIIKKDHEKERVQRIKKQLKNYDSTFERALAAGSNHYVYS